jgi:hypothetical protein
MSSNFIISFRYRAGSEAGAGAGIELLAGGAGVVFDPLTRSTAVAGRGLSALASSRLTCHISFDVNMPEKAGIPVNRIPFETFQ